MNLDCQRLGEVDGTDHLWPQVPMPSLTLWACASEKAKNLTFCRTLAGAATHVVTLGDHPTARSVP